MKKRNKKIVLSLLTAACISCGAIGLSACKTTKPETNDDSRIVQVYNSYVAYAEAKGETPLSYDEWLSSIKGADGTNGTNGTNGKDGATWLTGETAPSSSAGEEGDLYLDTVTCDIYKKGASGWSKIGNIKGSSGSAGAPGQAGTGITNIESEVVSVDGKDYVKFTFTLSDGTPIEKLVELPASGGVRVEHVYAGLSQVPVGTPLNQALNQISISVSYTGNMNGNVSLDDEDIDCDFSEVNLDAVGIYNVQGTYKGVSFKLRVAVIDPEQQGEPSLLGIINENDIQFPMGIPESELTNMLMSAQVRFVYSNGTDDWKTLVELGITEEALGTAVAEADIDLETEGEYTVNLTYQGNEIEIAIKVVDMNGGNGGGSGDNEDAQLVGVLTGTDTKSSFAYGGSAVSAIALFSDGSAQLQLSPSVVAYDSEPAEPEIISAEFELDDYEQPSTIIIKDGGVKGAIFAVDVTNAEMSGQVFTAQFTDYEFTDAPYNTFSGVNADGESFTLAMYPNGMAKMTVGSNSWNVGVVIGTEQPEAGADTATVYVQVPGVEYFSAEVPADIQGNQSITNLAPIASEPEHADPDSMYGVWTAISATSYYKDGHSERETGWSQVLLNVKDDGTVEGVALYNGGMDRVRFTYVLEGDGLRLTMVYHSVGDPASYGSVLLTLADGELTYEYTPNSHDDSRLARGVGIFVKK